MIDLLRGAGYVVSGFGLLRKPGIRRYVIVPLLINIVLFAGLIVWAYGWVEAFSLYLSDWLPDWLEWLSVVIWPLFVLSSLLVIFYGFSLIANLIGAPFNGMLAEAVESQLTGEPLQGGWKQVIADIAPSLFAELRKLLYFAVRALPLLLLMLIPVLNLGATLVWMLFSAWMMSVQYVDYPMANHRLFFKQQRERLRQRPLLAWGFGGLVMFLTLIPVVNFVVMPAAVAGATQMWVRELKTGGHDAP